MQYAFCCPCRRPGLPRGDGACTGHRHRGRCATPDTHRLPRRRRASQDATLRSEVGLAPGHDELSRDRSRHPLAVCASASSRTCRRCVSSRPAERAPSSCSRCASGHSSTTVDVTGADRLSRNEVRDRVDLLVWPAGRSGAGRTRRRSASTRSISRKGYYLARVHVDTTLVDGKVDLMLPRRRRPPTWRSPASTSRATRASSDKTVVGGDADQAGRIFLVSRKGEFDADKYAADLGEKIPGAVRVAGLHRRAGA